MLHLTKNSPLKDEFSSEQECDGMPEVMESSLAEEIVDRSEDPWPFLRNYFEYKRACGAMLYYRCANCEKLLSVSKTSRANLTRHITKMHPHLSQEFIEECSWKTKKGTNQGGNQPKKFPFTLVESMKSSSDEGKKYNIRETRLHDRKDEVPIDLEEELPNENVYRKNESLNRLATHYDGCLQDREDEYEKIATYWAVELSKLSSEQQIHAKKAVNDILYEGQLGNLQRNCVTIRLLSERNLENVSGNPGNSSSVDKTS